MINDVTPTITDDEVAALPLADAKIDLLRELLVATDADAPPPHRERRWVVALVAAASIMAVLGAASAIWLADDDRAAGPAVGTAPRPAAFQVRYVALTSTDPRPSDQEWQELRAFRCADATTAVAPEKAELVCDDTGTKYLLGPAAVQGGVLEARVDEAPVGDDWTVSVQLDDASSTGLAQLTTDVLGFADPPRQLAIVLDGELLSAPTVGSEIRTGQLQITGLSRAQASRLASRLGS